MQSGSQYSSPGPSSRTKQRKSIQNLVSAIATVPIALSATDYSICRSGPDGIIRSSLSDDVDSVNRALDQTYLWKDAVIESKKVPLFQSILIIEADGILFDPTDAGFHYSSILPSRWVLENKLDIWDSYLPRRDPDRDGFANFEEYFAKTDPNDEESHPPLVTKLEYVDHRTRLYGVKFAALPSDEKCQLNRVGSMVFGSQATFILAVGEVSEDKQLRVRSISPDEVVVEFLPNKKLVTLPKRENVSLKTRYAELKPSVTSEDTIVVREGTTFSLPGEPGVDYLLESVNETACLIKGDGKEYRKTLRR